jgi:hypothetical protein
MQSLLGYTPQNFGQPSQAMSYSGGGYYGPNGEWYGTSGGGGGGFPTEIAKGFSQVGAPNPMGAYDPSADYIRNLFGAGGGFPAGVVNSRPLPDISGGYYGPNGEWYGGGSPGQANPFPGMTMPGGLGQPMVLPFFDNPAAGFGGAYYGGGGGMGGSGRGSSGGYYGPNGECGHRSCLEPCLRPKAASMPVGAGAGVKQ